MTQAAALQSLFRVFRIVLTRPPTCGRRRFPWLPYDLVNGGWGDRLFITVTYGITGHERCHKRHAQQ